MSTDSQHKAQHGSCDRCEDAASYLCGEMAETDARSFEEHSASCPACNDLVQQLGRVVSTLKADTATEPRMDLTHQILSRIPEKRWSSGTPVVPAYSWFSLPVLLRAAACMVVLLAGALLATRFLYPPAHDSDSLAGTTPTGTQLDESGRIVNQSMAWLVKTQEPDGAWDPTKWEGKKQYKMGLTGMAMLALLQGRGGTSIEANRVASSRALDYILKHQAQEGHFGDAQNGLMYNHGIATVAVLEAYRKTGNSDLKGPLDKAIAFTRTSQLRSGGWGYWGQGAQGPNTSISVWQLRALCQARDLGWKGTTEHLHAGLLWLRGMVDDSGMVGYRKVRDFPSGSDSLSAMGAYCFLTASLQLDDWQPVGARIKAALLKASPSDPRSVDFYRSYFLASALRTGAVPGKNPELASLQRSLIDLRVTSGANVGTWNPEGPWAAVGGRIYSTAMATLSL